MTWPRISPPVKFAVWMLKYQRPASSWDSSVSEIVAEVAEPENEPEVTPIGKTSPFAEVAPSVTAAGPWPTAAGPWKWALLVPLLRPEKLPLHVNALVASSYVP